MRCVIEMQMTDYSGMRVCVYVRVICLSRAQTVGSGQGEVGVADVADCVLLVLPPAAGGSLQVCVQRCSTTNDLCVMQVDRILARECIIIITMRAPRSRGCDCTICMQNSLSLLSFRVCTCVRTSLCAYLIVCAGDEARIDGRGARNRGVEA